MTMRWQDKIRAMSLSHLYMLETLPESLSDIPPHFVWQAPFVFAPREEPVEQLAARVRCAGELWLINYDLRPHQELVIAHVERPWFMAFQRGLVADEKQLVIGPIERRVLRPTDGLPVLDLPLRFREAEQATSRELWRQINARLR